VSFLFGFFTGATIFFVLGIAYAVRQFKTEELEREIRARRFEREMRIRRS
jgi:hypothetical protein